jgi:hypothetical protein
MKLNAAVDTKSEVQDDHQRLEELDGCLKGRMFSTEVSLSCHNTRSDLPHVFESVMRMLKCFTVEISNRLRWGVV